MRRRQSIRIQLLWAAIRLSDSARRGALVILLTGIALTGACVWLTASAKASHWVWKSWERMFGPVSISDVRPRILAQTGGSGNFTITAIDEPNAGTGAAEGTIVFAINASGAMTGAYADQAGVAHGFVDANGTFTSFDAFNEAGLNPKFGWFQGTAGISIDTAGDVAGAYIDGNNAYHGFVREASTGAITTFDDPNAPTATSSRGTFPLSINNAGQVVGTRDDTTSFYHGFLYTIATGTFTEIDEPNAANGTTPLSINDAGTVTGRYADSSGNRHGFIAIPPYLSPSDYTSFDVSGAATNTGKGGDFSGTIPMSIDTAGDVTGSFTDSNLVRHGFIRTASGTITTFDVPGANTTSQSGTIGGTLPMGFDPTGNYIVGMYTDSTGLGHGFVYSQPLTGSGSFATFTPPNMTTSTAVPIQGAVFSVNASGTVVGFYLDSNLAAHGFQYTPSATPPPSGFTLSASPTSVSAAQGASATSTITVTDVGGFSGDVTLAASGLPSGVDASFAAGSTAGTQVLTLAAATSAAVTSSPVTVTITGTSGALTETTSIELTITAQPSFTAGSGGTTSLSVSPGSTTGNTGTISVVGTNGFSGTVNLTCTVATSMTGVNDMPTCSLNPTSVTLSGTTPQTSTLTVSTTAASSAVNRMQRLFAPMTGGTALALVAFFLVPKRRRNWLVMLGLFVLIISASAIGCGGGGSKGGGGGNSGTTAGTYTITVTGASGGINATVATVKLTVQ
jgi:probable HAF family extracellular repeat protein